MGRKSTNRKAMIRKVMAENGMKHTEAARHVDSLLDAAQRGGVVMLDEWHVISSSSAGSKALRAWVSALRSDPHKGLIQRAEDLDGPPRQVWGTDDIVSSPAAAASLLRFMDRGRDEHFGFGAAQVAEVIEEIDRRLTSGVSQPRLTINLRHPAVGYTDMDPVVLSAIEMLVRVVNDRGRQTGVGLNMLTQAGGALSKGLLTTSLADLPTAATE